MAVGFIGLVGMVALVGFELARATPIANGDLVPVVVAKQHIPVYTIFATDRDADAWFQIRQIPNAVAPHGGFNSIADFVQNELTSGKKATAATIYPDEPIFPSMFIRRR